MKLITQKNRADFRLAVALVLGAVVLAAVSWWLPGHFRTPLTADMRGTVEEVREAFDGYRRALCLEGNSVKYTLPTETFYELDPQPQPGDEVGLTYEVTSVRNIRDLKIFYEDGSSVTLYTSEDPVAKQLFFWQALAFAVYGAYAAVCAAVYRVKTKKKKND